VKKEFKILAIYSYIIGIMAIIT